MTIEQLTEKKAELQRQREQMIANVNAIDGAIQFCAALITDLQNSEEKVDGKKANKLGLKAE